MILRVVLSVLLSTALVGVSLPAIDQAALEATDTRVQADLRQFQSAVQTLPQQTDPVGPDDALIHQTITLTLPEKSWTSAPLEYVQIEPTRTGGILRWQVNGGHEHTIFVEKVPIQTPESATGIHLTKPGTHRLSLTLVERNEERVVVLRRLP